MAQIKSFPNNQDVFIGAEDVMRWLHGRTSGVFGAEGNASVAPVLDTMAVTVSDGNGWMSNGEGYGVVWWNDNESASGSKLRLSVDMADAVLPRIDRVVVSWQTTNYVALPEVTILKGTPASNPVAPALTNNNILRQISLAAIYIPAGSTAITGVMITDERLNPEVCGIVSERMTADTSMVNAQYLAAVEELRTAIQQAWNGEIPDGSITQEMLDPNIKLGSNDIYIGTEEPTGEDRPKVWIDPEGTELTPEQIGALSMELLWENANSSSSFTAQTVTVANVGQNFTVIEYRASSSSSTYALSTFIRTNGTTVPLDYFTNAGKLQRRRVKATTTTVEFEKGLLDNNEDNSLMIPVRIYAVKGANL